MSSLSEKKPEASASSADKNLLSSQVPLVYGRWDQKYKKRVWIKVRIAIFACPSWWVSFSWAGWLGLLADVSVAYCFSNALLNSCNWVGISGDPSIENTRRWSYGGPVETIFHDLNRKAWIDKKWTCNFLASIVPRGTSGWENDMTSKKSQAGAVNFIVK